MGRKCVRPKTVWSPAMGRYVKRCASFSGGRGGGGLGAMPITFDQVKDTLLTGGLAVGGAVVANKLIAYVAPYLKLDPADPANKWYISALEVGVGIGAGWAIGKYANKPEIGAAVAIGPTVVNGLKIAGYVITPAIASPVSGYRLPAYRSALGSAAQQPGLGIPINPAEFPPNWAYRSPYMNQIAQEAPPWAM